MWTASHNPGKTVDKLSERATAAIPIGGAGLIVIYSRSEAAKVEPAVTHGVKKVIADGGPRPGE